MGTRRASVIVAIACAVGVVSGAAGGAAATALLWSVPPVAPIAASQAPAPSSAPIASRVYDKVRTGVVEIVVATGRSAGNGSGFVVDQGGGILTNFHVVASARTITVRFADGQTRRATLADSDRTNDLALLRVADVPAGVTPLVLGSSSAVRVGDVAIAIGSPFGLEQTVTQGIVSAVDRTWSPGNGATRRDLLQTDAPINPGNSGGPLFNDAGEVIGVNSLIESPVQGSVGIGFAIEIDVAKALLSRV